MRRTLLEVAACLMAVAFFIQAAPLSMAVSQPYLRLIPGGVPAAGYFNITNYAAPNGNLSSPLFGRSTTLAGGNGGIRRLDLQVRFEF